jgi:hypothetical protein
MEKRTNKYKLAFFITLSALILTLIFNPLFYLSPSEKIKGTYTIISIYKWDKSKNDWILVFKKENDLLKYNFGNLTRLFFNNIPHTQGQNYFLPFYFTFFFLKVYNSFNDMLNDVNPITEYCSVQGIASSSNQPAIFGHGFAVKQGDYRVPFQIGFGNSTSQFDPGFPTLYHKTTIVNFQYRGNQCYEASHEGLSFNLNFQVKQSTDYTNKYIYITYVGYWQNTNYNSYSIVYTRLYLPLIYQYHTLNPPSANNKWAVMWLVVAEDLVSPAVSVALNDIVKFEYTLAINV